MTRNPSCFGRRYDATNICCINCQHQPQKCMAKTAAWLDEGEVAMQRPVVPYHTALYKQN